MRILLINQAFVGPDEPGHTRHYELAQWLRRQGHELVIIASKLNYQTGRPVTGRRGLVVEQDLSGVRVLRVAVLPALHRNYLVRVLSFLSFMLNSFLATLRVGKVDLVLGTSPPIFQALTAWFTACLRGVPFLFEVRDLWPEFGISMGVIRNPLIIRLSRGLENFLYRRARWLLVNSPAYVSYLIERGVAESKVRFIPYGADLEVFHPDNDGSQVRASWHAEGKFVILYAGAMGQANQLEQVLQAADLLRGEPRILFLLAGDGKQRGALEAEAKRMALPNLRFLTPAPKRSMPALLAACDACLAVLQNIPAFTMTYPNKVFDAMAAAKPSLLVIDGVIREVIEASGGGICAAPGDPSAMAAAARQLAADPEAARGMGRRARAWAEIHFDRRTMMRETLKLFEETLGT